MKILHLISNHKFTGPVDPALFLAEGLNALEKTEVLTGIGKVPEWMEDKLARSVARERGLELVEELELKKHRRLFKDYKEIEILKKLEKDFCPDVIHSHIGNDLRLAVKAELTPLVHSLYVTRLKELAFGQRRLIKRKASGIVVHSRQLFEELQGKVKVKGKGKGKGKGWGKANKVLYVPPVLDLERFDPVRALSSSMKFTIPEGRIAIGIVARMQPHRRFGVLLRAFKEAVRKVPELMLVIVGRGTHREKVAKEPVKELGLENDVLFSGYISGDDYVALLKQFSYILFLVPGSDGTCRALREGMAMGLPVIGSSQGMIPELICGEGLEGGIVVEDLSKNLAQTMISLAQDKDLKKRLGENARKKAETFNFNKVASKVFDFYREICTVSGQNSVVRGHT